jgi:hypothetical protein
MAIPKLNVAFGSRHTPQELNEPNIVHLGSPEVFPISSSNPQTPHCEEAEEYGQKTEDLPESCVIVHHTSL